MLQACPHCWLQPKPSSSNCPRRRRQWGWAPVAWEEWAAWAEWIIRQLTDRESTSIWLRAALDRGSDWCLGLISGSSGWAELCTELNRLLLCGRLQLLCMDDCLCPVCLCSITFRVITCPDMSGSLTVWQQNVTRLIKSQFPYIDNCLSENIRKFHCSLQETCYEIDQKLGKWWQILSGSNVCWWFFVQIQHAWAFLTKLLSVMSHSWWGVRYCEDLSKMLGG